MARTAATSLEARDVRTWCRTRFGKEWWNVDKAIKKERMANARRALTEPNSPNSPNLPESPNSPESAAAMAAALALELGPVQPSPNPLKRTYLLKMRWSYSNEQTVERVTPVDPATCIGKEATFKKIGPRERGGAGGAVYLLSTSCFTFDYEESEVEDEEDHGIYFGEHPLPGVDRFPGFVKKGDTADMLGQKLARFNLCGPLVIDEVFWAAMKPATQEAILRDSSATRVFLCDAQF
jgi:hypothetical protein